MLYGPLTPFTFSPLYIVLSLTSVPLLISLFWNTLSWPIHWVNSCIFWNSQCSHPHPSSQLSGWLTTIPQNPEQLAAHYWHSKNEGDGKNSSLIGASRQRAEENEGIQASVCRFQSTTLVSVYKTIFIYEQDRIFSAILLNLWLTYYLWTNYSLTCWINHVIMEGQIIPNHLYIWLQILLDLKFKKIMK